MYLCLREEAQIHVDYKELRAVPVSRPKPDIRVLPPSDLRQNGAPLSILKDRALRFLFQRGRESISPARGRQAFEARIRNFLRGRLIAPSRKTSGEAAVLSGCQGPPPEPLFPTPGALQPPAPIRTRRYFLFPTFRR
jgi:hypothetical protein